MTRPRGVRARNESAWLLPPSGFPADHRLRRDMRRFDDADEVDMVVVGCGAGGGVLTQRLARAGWRVVAMDAGPFWDPDADWVSDEWGSHHLYWTEPRVIGGSDPVPLGANNSGRGVGGSMVHFAGYTPRLHPSDFRTCGFCLQGCRVNAKASPLVTHVPDALAHGAEIRANSMVTRVEIGADGLARGVVYVKDSVERRQRARTVAVAGYSIETPRLLLNSAGARFPDGLCNDHDQVGRYLMVQGAPQTAGRFDQEVRMYKAPPPEVSTEAFYETDPSKPYKRGFSIQTVGPLPITWAEHVAAGGHWGHVLREYMRDYVHWCVLGVLAELLPLPGNRVTLSSETDRYGLPVAHFSYSQCDNDRALIKAGTQVMEEILQAAGAQETVTIERYAHLVGGCRMAADERSGVVDRDLRTFAVPNLYVSDGSVLPTQGSANPALTIMVLAVRLGDHLTRR
jgi:choline dehydrogenase-like flavoprotein